MLSTSSHSEWVTLLLECELLQLSLRSDLSGVLSCSTPTSLLDLRDHSILLLSVVLSLLLTLAVVVPSGIFLWLLCGFTYLRKYVPHCFEVCVIALLLNTPNAFSLLRSCGYFAEWFRLVLIVVHCTSWLDQAFDLSCTDNLLRLERNAVVNVAVQVVDKVVSSHFLLTQWTMSQVHCILLIAWSHVIIVLNLLLSEALHCPHRRQRVVTALRESNLLFFLRRSSTAECKTFRFFFIVHC